MACLQDQVIVGLGLIPKTSWAMKTCSIKGQESEKARDSQPNENARGVNSKPKCIYKSAIVKLYSVGAISGRNQPSHEVGTPYPGTTFTTSHVNQNVDARLPGKGNSNSYGARLVHRIITMMKCMWTSRLSVQNSSSRVPQYSRVDRRTTCRTRKWPDSA